jgi:SAM-dependent methyltransferase
MNGKLDFGYSWFWTYGHLIAVGALLVAAGVSSTLGGPSWVTTTVVMLSIWAFTGFVVMRGVVRMNELGELAGLEFAPGASRVLDLGCGAGRISIMVALERPEARVVGLDDFSADYIAGHGEENTRANLHRAGVADRVEIRSGDMRRIPFPNESFDAVVSSAAIDHLKREDIPLALAEANRVLRPNGQVLLWVIVPNLWMFIAYGPLLYFHNATRRDWRRMLGAAGFRIDDEGTARGLAWLEATRTGTPLVADASEVPARRVIPTHAVWLCGALIAGGVGMRLLGLEASGLWIAGAGVAAIHVGGAVIGLTALRGWIARRRDRGSVA